MEIFKLRSRWGRGGSREHSAPATATPPTSKVRHLSQLLPEQRHAHNVCLWVRGVDIEDYLIQGQQQ
eukprot:1122679-Pelagomonas_calceolata.AAC.1